MAMTPPVAAARRKHKAKELASALAAGGLLLLVCGALVWSCGQMVVDSWKEQRANEQYRAGLAASGAKSEAHHFLVSNWLQCNSILHTRASCYSAIRGTAASRGDIFVSQVDAAAKELGLI